MPIELKLATDDTPQPWHLALEPLPAELDYAREGLPSAPPRSWLRSLLAVLRLIFRGIGKLVSATLLAVALICLGAAIAARLLLVGLAKLVLLVRGASPVRLYERLRYGRVPLAQIAQAA